jgi:hypothetical protein
MQAISEERVTERLWIIWSIRLAGFFRVMKFAAA